MNSGFDEVFKLLEKFSQTKSRFIGVVIENSGNLEILTNGGEIIDVKWSEDYSWARPYISENRRGANQGLLRT